MAVLLNQTTCTSQSGHQCGALLAYRGSSAAFVDTNGEMNDEIRYLCQHWDAASSAYALNYKKEGGEGNNIFSGPILSTFHYVF